MTVPVGGEVSGFCNNFVTGGCRWGRGDDLVNRARSVDGADRRTDRRACRAEDQEPLGSFAVIHRAALRLARCFARCLGRPALLFALLAAAARAQAPIEVVDVADDGSIGNQGGFVDAGAVVSLDGRYVVFTSLSTNLSPLANGSAQQVYVRDRVAGTTTLLSVNADGVAADSHSYAPVITPSGRFVAF